MKKTLGTMIAQLRKQQGMTQLELAEKMGVTDKAVSKWERDLSCPDINSVSALMIKAVTHLLFQIYKCTACWKRTNDFKNILYQKNI